MKGQHEGAFGVMEWLTLYLDCGSGYTTMCKLIEPYTDKGKFYCTFNKV